jgi:hypothetical protein
VAFCDDDDLWEPGKLVAQLTALRRQPHAAVCFTGLAAIDGASVGRGRLRSRPWWYDQWPRLGFLSAPGYYIAPSSVVTPRAVIEAVGGFDEDPLLRGREDIEWLVRIAFRTRQRFLRIPAPLVHYRRIEGRPGIGLQRAADRSKTDALLTAVHRNSGMSERSFRRFSTLHLVLFARVQWRMGVARSEVLATLREADRFGFSLLGWWTRMRLRAERGSRGCA